MNKPARFFLILMILLCGSLCQAQDWRTLRTNGVYMFSDDVFNEYHAYRVDSAWASGSDSIFMSFPVIQQLDYDCYSPTEGSWTGRMTVVKPDGDDVFINYRYDSIIIRTTAGVGDSWLMCDSGNVTATVIAIKDTNLLGLNDSVKVISLSSSLSYINGTKLLLSKHYGLIKMPELFNFPDDPWGYQHLTYSLKGMSNPQVGVQNLSRRETYTYDIGDEFHRYHYDESGGWSMAYRENESWAIYRVLEKVTTASPDTLMYRFERCMKQHNYYSDTDTLSDLFTLFHDTLLITHVLNNTDALNFDQLPGEPAYNNYNQLYEHTMNLHTSGKRGKSYPDTDETYWLVNPLCWSPPIVDACVGRTYYYDGIYGPDYYCAYWVYIINTQLVYYKKGSETWGTPYDCGTILSDDFNEEVTARMVTVSPNPATDHIEIALKNLNAALSFELYNLTGNVVKSFLITEPTTTISCSDLNAGLYLYRISGTSGFIASGKLAVQ